ncbi:MAG TPA: DUF4834 domain-containing protein [Cytophagales bacterium]|jgi:hypothetical protein|nr:DUF4834 domain-containing protein [Cytophagales bacterium]
MIRLLLIFGIVYFIFKIVGSLLRAGAASQQSRNFESRRPEGNIHVDKNPMKQKRGGIKGGDYVDYEEVK